MLRSLAKTVSLSLLLVATTVGLYAYRAHTAAERQLAAAESRNRELATFIQRLSGERRVANVIVTDRSTDATGTVRTTLVFVEYAADGREMPPKRFTIEGDRAHIDALVVKFDRDFVLQGDALRGHSIALFHRLFGDRQTPADGFPIDEPGRVPDLYKHADSRVSAFEQELWSNFWRLTTDEAYRRDKGVRVAVAQSVWGPFEPDRLYTITLEAAGGLNITSEPLKGIYREALRQRYAAQG
ncbi:MAG TPA: hypothetical protein VK324_12440 [Tepidisphaeraceae bacterium]|nr:hypothetical protein [Tepidisphaeraceae bacterium]